MAVTQEVKEQGDAIRYSWFQADGLVAEDGSQVDRSKLREVIGEILVSQAFVEDRKEKLGKALTRARLARLVVPSAPDDEALNDADESMIEAWDGLMRQVFAEVELEPSKPLQTWIGENTADEDGVRAVMVKARVKLGGENIAVVYVTRDPYLLMADFVAPLEKACVDASKKLGRNAAMIANRVPSLEATTRSKVTASAKNVAAAGKTEYQLALAAGDSEPAEPVAA